MSELNKEKLAIWANHNREEVKKFVEDVKKYDYKDCNTDEIYLGLFNILKEKANIQTNLAAAVAAYYIEKEIKIITYT